MMSNKIDQLLKDFLSKHTTISPSLELLEELKKEYMGDVDALLNHLYLKYKKEELNKEKRELIKTTYGLKDDRLLDVAQIILVALLGFLMIYALVHQLVIPS